MKKKQISISSAIFEKSKFINVKFTKKRGLLKRTKRNLKTQDFIFLFFSCANNLFFK